MMNKSKKRKLLSMPILVILIIILNLAFLFFTKYNNQNLSTTEFEVLNFGNLLNIIFAFLLITGFLIAYFKKSVQFSSRIFLITFLLNQLFLIGVYVVRLIQLPFKNIYFLGQTGDELFSGALLVFYTLTLLMMIYIVWLHILNVKNVLVLRAFVYSTITLLFFLLFVFIFIIAKESTFNENIFVNDKNNIGVVLGAAVWSENKPSPSLTSRVDKALKLYEQKKISRIYLTGSNAPGELAESEVALNYIKSRGFKTSNVFLEKKTTSTNEQIQYIKNNLVTVLNRNIIVISDSYHLVRVLEIAKFNGIKIQVSASELSQSFEKAVYNKLREAIALTMFWLYGL